MVPLMNLMMALYKHCGGWWTQIIQTAWWEIFTDCPGDIARKNLIRHSLRLGTAPTQCVERLVQYKEGSRRRRYRWCSTRRVQGAVEGGTGGAVQGGEQYIQAAIANQSASRSVRTRSQSVDTTIITWEWDRITGILVMKLCYCVTVLLCYWDQCLPWFAQINKHQTLVGDVLEQIMNWTEQAFQ